MSRDQSNEEFLTHVYKVAEVAESDPAAMDRLIGKRMPGWNRRWNFPTAKEREAYRAGAAPVPEETLPEELQTEEEVTAAPPKVNTHIKGETRTRIMGEKEREARRAQREVPKPGGRNTLDFRSGGPAPAADFAGTLAPTESFKGDFPVKVGEQLNHQVFGNSIVTHLSTYNRGSVTLLTEKGGRKSIPLDNLNIAEKGATLSEDQAKTHFIRY